MSIDTLRRPICKNGEKTIFPTQYSLYKDLLDGTRKAIFLYGVVPVGLGKAEVKYADESFYVQIVRVSYLLPQNLTERDATLLGFQAMDGATALQYLLATMPINYPIPHTLMEVQ